MTIAGVDFTEPMIANGIASNHRLGCIDAASL
jgi:hypothetical protein